MGLMPTLGLSTRASEAPSSALRRRLPWMLLALALLGAAGEGLRWHAQADLIQRLRAGVPVPPRAASAGPAATGSGAAAPTASETRASDASTAAAPRAAAVTDDGEPARWHFGQALALSQAGDDEAALTRYRALFNDPELGVAARYNAANVLLRRGIALREAQQADAAYPFIEGAKEGYRNVLRADPTQRPARYNLERALRLIPEQDTEAPDAVAPEHSSRAVTTQRAIPPGLP